MAFFNASTSASLSSDGGCTEDGLLKFESAAGRKSRENSSALHRTLSSPSTTSSYRPSRSYTCPRSINWNSRDVAFSARSLRSVSSPSRMSSVPIKQNILNFSRQFITNSSSSISNSLDIKEKSQQPKVLSSQSMDSQPYSDQDLFQSNDGLHYLNGSQILVQDSARRVGRSISSPEGLHPVLQPANSYPFYSPSSPGRLTYSASTQTESPGILNDRLNISASISASSCLPSPSISYSGNENTFSDRSAQNVCSPPLQGAGSLNSSIYSSRTSVRGGMDSESLAASRGDALSYQGRQTFSSFWSNEPSPGVSLRLQGGGTEDRPRLSQLALAHLTSRDLTSIHFQTPPPSYEKLCNPEALPTYQEAIQGETKAFRLFQDRRMVFTLPSVPDFNSSHTDPLLQETERSFSGGILSSLAAELSDSDGGYTTIMDAIPSHPAREACPTVPIRFVPRWSISRMRSSRRRLPCFSSVCNKSLVRKELNSRWPFIVCAREDENYLGLLLVECSSNLTVAQLPDAPPSAGPVEGGLLSYSEAMESNLTSEETGNLNEVSTMDLETAALNSNVTFFLCGKCVSYDSFDVENVRSHIEYDCMGPTNKWANMSELYLVMRAICFVLIVILVLMILPLGRW